MELYQLNTFVTVAGTKNVTRAAELLHTTPPSVSNHIKQVEEELDILLFTRTSKGMQITSQGAKLLDQARVILESVRDFRDLARSLKSEVQGNLSLAVNAMPDFLKVPEIIDHIIEYYPGIKLEILPSSTGLILEGIEQGLLDCGFAFGPFDRNGTASFFLSRVDLVIAIPSKFKTAYAHAPMETLIDLPWVVPENQCPFLKVVTDHLEQHGLSLEKKLFSNDDITKLTLVRKGAAVCVLEKSEAQGFIREGIVVPWTGPVQFESRLSFVYPADRTDDLLISAMVSIIRELWNK